MANKIDDKSRCFVKNDLENIWIQVKKISLKWDLGGFQLWLTLYIIL